MSSEYLTIKEVAEICGIQLRTLQRRCEKNRYITRTVPRTHGGIQKEILISSLEPELRAKVYEYIKNRDSETNTSVGSDSISSQTIEAEDCPTDNAVYPLMVSYIKGTAPAPVSFIDKLVTHPTQSDSTKICVPEKAKEIARARVDVLSIWQSYISGLGTRKANLDFCRLFNEGKVDFKLQMILGNISKSSLYRWKKLYEESGRDYYSLIPNYNYGSEFKYATELNETEQKAILGIMLHPNKFDLGSAYSLIKYNFEQQGKPMKSYGAYANFIRKFKQNHYDVWTLMREGEKALKDKVQHYNQRDWSTLSVGDMFVADGNELDCQCINPFTGKPCRAVLVTYMDAYSWYVAGYEIMLTENTQSISSALRNAIINFGRTPKMIQLDNGRAFKGKFFTGLKSSGIKGIYEKLGIEVRFANAYNGRTKVVERFFKIFTSTFTKMLNSYIGNNIENKPAHMRRNEKFHQKLHNNKVPTIEELKIFLDKWFEFRNSQPCPNVKDKTVGEVFNAAKGEGVDINKLDDLMMADEIRTIQRNGVSLFGNYYYSPEMYGLKMKVRVKYCFSDISYVRVYSLKGDFICTAHTDLKLNPHADIFGEAKDMYTVRKALQLQKKQIEKTKSLAMKLVPKSLDLLNADKIYQIPEQENKKDNGADAAAGVAAEKQLTQSADAAGVNVDRSVDEGVAEMSSNAPAPHINPISYLGGYTDLINDDDTTDGNPFDIYGDKAI